MSSFKDFLKQKEVEVHNFSCQLVQDQGLAPFSSKSFKAELMLLISKGK